MSLIERAVDRLTGEHPPTPPQAEPQTAVPEHKPSTIEAFAERLGAEVAAPESSARAIAGAAPQVPTQAASPPEDQEPAGPVQVHFLSLRERGFVSPDGVKSRIAQEFRVIKRPLIANAYGKGVSPVRNGKRIMITSAFPAEGKSFVAINLALSIAGERDNKVLLVDADVARPSIPRVVGFEAKTGLMDWLIDGNRDVADLVLRTDVEKLALLPSGRRHDQATEFLSSASMARLLDQISARFPDRVVIFDAPPLLLTTESRALAEHMGQIVLVVEYGKTPRSAVLEALSTIEGTAEVVSVLLNKAEGFGTGGYGKYGGYYRHGDYGYGNDTRKAS